MDGSTGQAVPLVRTQRGSSPTYTSRKRAPRSCSCSGPQCAAGRRLCRAESEAYLSGSEHVGHVGRCHNAPSATAVASRKQAAAPCSPEARPPACAGACSRRATRRSGRPPRACLHTAAPAAAGCTLASPRSLLPSAHRPPPAAACVLPWLRSRRCWGAGPRPAAAPARAPRKTRSASSAGCPAADRTAPQWLRMGQAARTRRVNGVTGWRSLGDRVAFAPRSQAPRRPGTSVHNSLRLPTASHLARTCDVRLVPRLLVAVEMLLDALVVNVYCRGVGRKLRMRVVPCGAKRQPERASCWREAPPQLPTLPGTHGSSTNQPTKAGLVSLTSRPSCRRQHWGGSSKV